jgi:hypothetical protein
VFAGGALHVDANDVPWIVAAQRYFERIASLATLA